MQQQNNYEKPWSISTTVRNPKDIRTFYRVLKIIERDSSLIQDNQIKYQTLPHLQNNLYKPPTEFTRERVNEYYKDIEREMPYTVAEQIFDTQQYKDPAMRGRNSVAPMNVNGIVCGKKFSQRSKNHTA